VIIVAPGFVLNGQIRPVPAERCRSTRRRSGSAWSPPSVVRSSCSES